MWFCKLQNWTQPTNFDLYHLKIKFDLDKTAIDSSSMTKAMEGLV